MARPAYVYILECNDGSYYTGWTFDVDNRVKKHSAGKASFYTRSRLPVRLVYVQKLRDKFSAMKRECHIKEMDRSTKVKLVQEHQEGKKDA